MKKSIVFAALMLCGMTQQVFAQSPNDLTVKVRNTSFVMKFVPHGSVSFKKGDKTAHLSQLNDYYISETEVTNTLRDAVMNTTLTKVHGHACEFTWTQAMEFVKRLNNITGRNFRLCSETEWEYAARYGNSPGWKYSGSATLSDVWRGATLKVKESKSDQLNKPNKLGVYGMTNAQGEWCIDTVNIDGYTRVIRGKGYFYQKSTCEIGFRCGAQPNFETACIRLVLPYNDKVEVAPQAKTFAKNPVNLPQGMKGVYKGTTTGMNRITVDITRERRVLEAVDNKVGYGYMSFSGYMGEDMKYWLITKVTPAGKYAVNVVLESQEDGSKMTWKLSYSKLSNMIQVSSSEYKYNKTTLTKW